MTKAYVLLSGGIDSTTCLYLANANFQKVVGVSLFYGQRHKKEIEYAKKSCAALNIPHETLDVSSIVPKTMLTDPDQAIPNMSYDQITGVSPTYVPFRNGLLLAAAASLVHGRYEMEKAQGEWGLYFGAHAEDARNWAYPDCTPEFIGAMANAIFVGTYQKIRLHTPLEWLSKQEIIKLGTRFGVSWFNTWSCYAGGENHCGTCPTCRARKIGFKLAYVDDPTQYDQ